MYEEKTAKPATSLSQSAVPTREIFVFMYRELEPRRTYIAVPNILLPEIEEIYKQINRINSERKIY